MRGGTLVLAALVLLMSSLSPAAASPVVSPSPLALVPHAPILISGDSGFTATNGVTGGNGTLADPYIIEGWQIGTSTAPGIGVENTAAAFVVRNVTVQSSAEPGPAVAFTNVSHATLANASLSSYQGVFIRNATNVTVRNNTIDVQNLAVLCTGCAGVLVESNVVSDGITLYQSSDGVIRLNTWAPFAIYGITVNEARRVNVSDNDVSMVMNDGVEMGASRDVVVYRNYISNTRNAVSSRASSNVTLIANVIYDNGLGIDLFRSTNVTLHENRLLSANALLIEGDSLIHFDSHDIGPDNLVENRPIRYIKDCAPDTVLNFTGQYPGEVIVVNCPRVRISNLHFWDDQVGLELAFIQGGEVTNNVFARMGWGNPILTHSSGVILHHNYFVETHGWDDSLSNSWNAGYPTGGNWWSEYTGRDECGGPKQDDCPNPDGIGDFPMEAGYGNAGTFVDRYPLMWPMNWTGSPPVASFTVASPQVERGVALTFNASGSYDPDGHPVQVRWDWEADGIWDTWWSSSLVVQHAFLTTGHYTVRIAVRDVDGYWTVAYQYVDVVAPAAPAWLLVIPVLIAATLTVGLYMILVYPKRRTRAPPLQPRP